MFNMPPEAIVAEPAFGNEAVDMGVPFQIPAKSMQYHDNPRGEIFRFIQFEKEARDDRRDRMEETVKQGTILEKERPEIFVDGKNAVAVSDIYQFKGHTGSAVHGIFIATGRTETAVTAERDKLKFPAMCAGIHCATKRRVATA